MNPDNTEHLLFVIFAIPSIIALVWALRSRQFNTDEGICYAVFEDSDDIYLGPAPQTISPRRRGLLIAALAAVFGCILLSPLVTWAVARHVVARANAGQSTPKCPFQ